MSYAILIDVIFLKLRHWHVMTKSNISLWYQRLYRSD